MSRHARYIWLSLLVGPVALAQPTTPSGAGGPGVAPPGMDITTPHKSSLSATDMLKQGREYRAAMDKVVTDLQAMAEQARKQKDVIRLNCVMDKLMQVKVNMNIADEALQKLQEAAGRRDDQASLHEYTRVTITNQKVQVLQNEGQTCVGAELNYIGATRVEVEAPEVAENMTEPSLEPPPLERPNAASNFQQ